MTPADPAAATASLLDLQTADPARLDKIRRRMTNSWMMRAFMFSKLPLGLFAGLRVVSIDTQRCETSVPYRWRTTNPFRSTYFAAQAMAAELSTGTLALLATELAPQPVALLIIDLEATFGKKATALTTFTCEGGDDIFAAVERTLANGEPAVAKVETVGRMPDGTEVSRFHFTWSFKKRSPRS